MTQYEYKMVRESQDVKFLVEINKLGREGWHVLHFSNDGRQIIALLELAKPSK